MPKISAAQGPTYGDDPAPEVEEGEDVSAGTNSSESSATSEPTPSKPNGSGTSRKRVR